MIELRDSTVLVNNIKEYSAITKIAMKQGFTWASGDSLNKVFCRFPTRLEFRENYYTYYGSSRGRRARDYPECMVLIEGVRRLIMIRKEMANDKFKKVHCFGE